MKKILSLLLAIFCALGAFSFVGCGGGGKKDFPADITLANKTVDFDEEWHKLEVSGTLPNGTIVTYKYNNVISTNNKGKKNPGEYTVTAALECEGYNNKTLTATLIINNTEEGEEMTLLELVGDMVDYDGELHALTVTGMESYPGATVTYTYNDLANDGTGVIAEGIYNVEATVKCDGYKTKVLTATLKIGGSSSGDTSQTLRIWIMNAGYGSKWLTDSIKLFKQQDWVKQKYPNLEIPAFDDSGTGDFGLNQIISGTTQYDLVFPTTGLSSSSTYMDNYKYFENLDEGLFDQYVPGENILYKDKMVTSLYNDAEISLKAEGNKKVRFGTPWVNGSYGLIYNNTTVKKMLGEGYDISQVRTTNQFFALMDNLKANRLSTQQCLLHYGSAIVSYYTSLAQAWAAQYDGVETFSKMLEGMYLNDAGEYVMGAGSWETETGFGSLGRLEALKALERLMKPSNGYLGPYTTTWGSLGFNEQQQMMVIGQGPQYVFSWNGDWFDNETRSVQTANNEIRMLRTPVLSSIVDILDGSYSDNDLSDILALIDQDMDFASAKNAYDPQHGGDGSLLEEDYYRLREARNIMGQNGGHQAYIPTYSDAKGLAKDFLRFLATEQAIETYIKANGCVSVFNYDVQTENPSLYNQLSKMQQDNIKYKAFASKYNVILRSSGTYPLCYYAQMSLFSAAPHIAGIFASESNNKTAEEVWKECCYDEATFDTLLKRAGLK